MSRLEEAAVALYQILHNNTGSTDDWPIQLCEASDGIGKVGLLSY
jgi:hypothetical protein